jgi:predicted nuclease of predicted toxin-antitoxin system
VSASARFLADNDLNDAIVVGVQRREPVAAYSRLRHLGLAACSDPEVLDFAVRENWIVVSHDVNTMSATASARLVAGLTMNGLLLVHQRTPVSSIIDPVDRLDSPLIGRANIPRLSFFRGFARKVKVEASHSYPLVGRFTTDRRAAEPKARL